MFSSLLSPMKAVVPDLETPQAPNPVQETPILAILKVLVGSLRDSSPDVREAAAKALKENASRHAEVVLDCCIMAVKPATKRRGEAGPLPALAMQIIAHTIKTAGEDVLEAALMRDVVHVALTEMAAVKVVGSPEQRAASDILVAVGTRMPDVMFDDVILQLRGGAVPMLAIVAMFADFADVDAAHFVPRVKAVFARVLPALGGVRDQQRVGYAQAFTAWCVAIKHYQHDIYPDWNMDGDTRAFIFSAFELFHQYWLRAKESQVRLATVEALGEMSALIGRKELKKSVQKLLSALLVLYSAEDNHPVPITKAIHSLLDAALSNSDSPRLLDYQAVVYTLTTLLPMAAAPAAGGHHVNMRLKNMHEVLRCFDVVAQAYPEEMCSFLLQRIDTRDELTRLGALSFVRHLLPRLASKWQSKKAPLRERLGGLLKEPSLEIRKALAQVLLVVASSNYLDVENAEPFMEFLVRQCCLDADSDGTVPGKRASLGPSFLELRTICEKGLYLLASTTVNAEPYLWPYLLKTLTPPQYTPVAATICRCIAEIARRRADFVERDLAVLGGSFPSPQELLARLVVLLESPLERGRLGRNVLKVLYGLAPFFHRNVVLLWRDEVPKLTAFLEAGGEDWQQAQWEEMVLDLLAESLEVIADQSWTLLLGSAFEHQFRLYPPASSRHPFCYRCVGTVLQKLTDSDYCQHKLEQLYARADLSRGAHRRSLAMAVGLAANSHLETVLALLRRAFAQQKRRLRPFLGFLGFGASSRPEVETHFAALALMYGYTAFYAPPDALQSRIDALVGTGYFAELLKVDTALAKYAVIVAIDLLGRSVRGAADRGVPFPLKKKEDLLTHVMMLMAGTGWGGELLEIQSRALEACTTLISVDPPVSPIARNRLLESVIHLFAAPSEPLVVIEPLLSNLLTLLITMLRAEAREPQANAELLQLQLSQLDRFVTSSDDVIRERACGAALALLQEYRALLSGGSARGGGAGGSGSGACRETLLLGERLAVYLPRCTDQLVHVREEAGTIVEELASIASLLPETGSPPGSSSIPGPNDVTLDDAGQETSASSNEAVAQISREATSEEASESLERTKSSVENLVRTFERGSVDGPRTSSEQRSGGSTELAEASPAEDGETQGESAESGADRLVRNGSLPPSTSETQRRPNQSSAEQAWMKIRDLKGGLASQKDQYKVVGEIVLALCSELTTKEVVCFLVSLRLGDSPEASLGAACALREMVRCRGGKIAPKSVPPVVHNMLAAAGAAPGGAARREVLEALCELAGRGHALAVFCVVLEATTDQEDAPKPSMYDRMLRRVSQEERHSLDLLEEVFQVLANRSELAPELCDALLAQINPLDPKKAAQGPRSDKNDVAIKSSDFTIPDAATWALGVVLRPGTPIAAVCAGDRYPQAISALLLRIAPIRRTPLVRILAHDYVSTFEAFCSATSDPKMAAALSSNGPECIAFSEQWTGLIDEIVVCIAGNRRPRIAHVCEELWPALECEREEERTIAAAALSGFVVHVAENGRLLNELVERLTGHVNDEERMVRKFCVRGLTQVPSIAVGQYAPGLLSSIIPLLDDTSEDVIFTVLCGLEPLLSEASPDAVQPHLLTLADKLLTLQTREHTRIRAAAFSTLGFLVRFKDGSTPEFEDRIHRSLPRLLFHLEDPAATVRSACRKTLETLAPSFPGVTFSSCLLAANSGGETHKLPLRSLAAQLNQSHGEQLSVYIEVTEVELRSFWPTVRSIAAYFAACLIVEAKDRRVEKAQVDAVATVLVRMAVEDPSAEVRLTVAPALSILLENLVAEA